MSKLTKGRAQAFILFGSLDSLFCFRLVICNTVKFSHWENKTNFFSKIRVWRNLSVTEIHGSPYKYHVFVTVISSIIIIIILVIIVASGSQNVPLTMH